MGIISQFRHEIQNIIHIYDPNGWMVGSLSSLILIYVGIQRLLAYSISDFQGNAEKYNHVKHSTSET